MLPARILTAAVLLAGFFAALFWLDRAQFAWVVAVVVVIAAHEWAGLSGISGLARILYAAGTGLVYGAFALAWLDGAAVAWIFALAAVFWMCVVPPWMYRGVTSGARRWLAPIGLLVIVPAGAAMLVLSPSQLLAVLALTWISDTAAFFVGRAWGRRKLAPGISPGKTLEGAAGGVVCVAIYAIICTTLLPELKPFASGSAWVAILAAAILLAVMSILGDLFESAIKRQAGAKDSGKLLPGHGGVLDRIDSATSTLPVAALLFLWVLRP